MPHNDEHEHEHLSRASFSELLIAQWEKDGGPTIYPTSFTVEEGMLRWATPPTPFVDMPLDRHTFGENADLFELFHGDWRMACSGLWGAFDGLQRSQGKPLYWEYDIPKQAVAPPNHPTIITEIAETDNRDLFCTELVIRIKDIESEVRVSVNPWTLVRNAIENDLPEAIAGMFVEALDRLQHNVEHGRMED